MACLLIPWCFIPAAGREGISLEGEWAFRLDPEKRGIMEQWYAQELPDRVRLPGSLDEQGIGVPHAAINMGRLTPLTSYTGIAWYQKEVNIPVHWAKKQIRLFLERACWETTVYVDGIPAGSRNSLSVPHVYELTEMLTPGKHLLTISVDNTVTINIGHTYGNMLWPHALSAETQTNWNGIIGEIRLMATPVISTGNVWIHPDFEKKSIRVKVSVLNRSDTPVEGQLALSFTPGGASPVPVDFSMQGTDTLLEVKVPFGPAPGYWDEFTPALQELTVHLKAGETADHKSITFGLRDFRAAGHHFEQNGRRIFLRGKVCSAVFPLTGYPPMKTAEWERMFRIYRDYGLNHVRFHSWCPPEAAFAAADQLGMILQVEPPLWDGYGLVGSIPERAAFILAEVDRIVDAYGNHPSFCLMSMGNELGDGKDPYLAYLVDYLQQKDPRHLYTSTTHPAGMERGDDYFNAAATDAGICRGIKPFGDFRQALDPLDRPLVAHEVGQPAMYPDFEGIPKYTGHLKPLYLEVFRDSLKAHHMLDQADDFRQASGALLVELYKENIEAQLRTPNAAGFQLLDIQDYPGHGMATIGVLDVFLGSKGLVTPERYRRFCGPTVPLIRMPGFTYTSDEVLKVNAEIAHYGDRDLEKSVLGWTVKNTRGEVLGSGKLGPANIPAGGISSLGSFEMELSGLEGPEQLTIALSLAGSSVANDWKCWVYPARPDLGFPAGITVASTWDDETRDLLLRGGKVLLIPEHGTLLHAEAARWEPVFWSYQLFKQPKMMGILCDPEHPALDLFPTDYHTDWQWRDLLDQSEALVIDRAPADFRPIIQFVPDFNSNQKLSLLLEARVGSGRLMVCNVDMLNSTGRSPAMDQFFASLMNYMQSSSFQPVQSLPPEILDDLLKANEPQQHQGDEPDASEAVLNIKAAAYAAVGVPGA